MFMPSEKNLMACQISIVLCTFIHLWFLFRSEAQQWEAKLIYQSIMLFAPSYILYLYSYLSISIMLHVSVSFYLFWLNRSAQIPIDVFVIAASTVQTVRYQNLQLRRRLPNIHLHRRAKSRWKRKKHHTVWDSISIFHIT